MFIAALVPDLAPFISLIGAVFFSILGLMCPAVIHLFAFWEHGDEDDEDNEDTDSEDDLDFDGDYYAVSEDADLDASAQNRAQRRRSSGRSTRRRKGMSRWTMAKDLAIVMIALIALVSGTYASLVDIVAFYGAGGEAAAHGADMNGTMTTTTTIGPGPESAFLIAGETKTPWTRGKTQLKTSPPLPLSIFFFLILTYLCDCHGIFNYLRMYFH